MTEQAKIPPRNTVTWLEAADTAAHAVSVADRIETSLQVGLAARGAASLVVPGGRTPVAAFEALRRRDLPWDKVAVTLTDERWVDRQAPDSNETLLRDHLFQERAAAARFVSLKRDGGSPSDTLAAVAADLGEIVRPFDMVLLGMGGDGHFASLFPHSDGLEASLDPDGKDAVCAIMPNPLPDNAPYPRISLTLAALLDAREIFVLATGDAKRKVLETALERRAPACALPIRAVLDQTATPVTLCWAP